MNTTYRPPSLTHVCEAMPPPLDVHRGNDPLLPVDRSRVLLPGESSSGKWLSINVMAVILACFAQISDRCFLEHLT